MEKTSTQYVSVNSFNLSLIFSFKVESTKILIKAFLNEITVITEMKNDTMIDTTSDAITINIKDLFPPLWGFLFAKLATYAELNTTCNYIHRSFATALFVRLFDFMS